MIETVLSADDLPAANRFGYLRELMSLAPTPFDISSEHAADIRVYQRDIHLGDIRVWEMAFQPMTFRRTARLIRQSDSETYNICLLQQGVMSLAWGKNEATYGPSDLHVHDPSRPFVLRTRSAQELVTCVGIEIPRRQVPLGHGRVEQIIGRPIPGEKGMGALLAQFLTQLTADTASYRPADGPHLGIVAADLVAALFSHITEEDDRCVSSETHRRNLVLRVRAFIRQHLADPGLAPGVIAAAHHISTSYLHRLFQCEELTVTALIRRQRMEHARRDLADPAARGTPIHVIAARWGFRRAADFTRAFRHAYGVTPVDYRQQTLPQPE